MGKTAKSKAPLKNEKENNNLNKKDIIVENSNLNHVEPTKLAENQVSAVTIKNVNQKSKSNTKEPEITETTGKQEEKVENKKLKKNESKKAIKEDVQKIDTKLDLNPKDIKAKAEDEKPKHSKTIESVLPITEAKTVDETVPKKARKNKKEVEKETAAKINKKEDNVLDEENTSTNNSPSSKGKESHPKYIDMVVDALKSLNERGGSSRQALIKYIVSKYQLDQKKADQHIKITLKNGLKNSTFKKTSGTGLAGSFKLGDKPKPEKDTKQKKEPVSKTKDDTEKNSTANVKESKKIVAKKSKDVKKNLADNDVNNSDEISVANQSTSPLSSGKSVSSSSSSPVVTSKTGKNQAAKKDRKNSAVKKQLIERKSLAISTNKVRKSLKDRRVSIAVKKVRASKKKQVAHEES